MFGLLVGAVNDRGRGSLSPDRLLEYTSPEARRRLEGHSAGVSGGLLKIPIMSMPEIGSSEEQVAKVGSLTRVEQRYRDFDLVFEPNLKLPPIPSSDVERFLEGIHVLRPISLYRTHLEVHEIDLHRALLEWTHSDGFVAPSRRYLKFPTGVPISNQLTAMMPFDGTDAVWDAIQRSAAAAGLTRQRADSIWEKDAIIDDIAALLWTSRIIVVDYTKANPNVFYELGVAHTLGRNIIPIAEKGSRLPFDVNGWRALLYENTDLGLQDLEMKLKDRIQTLLSQSRGF